MSLKVLIYIFLGYEILINNSFHSKHNFKMNEQKFKNDLKNIFLKVGIKNQPTVFIVDKVDVIEEGN